MPNKLLRTLANAVVSCALLSCPLLAQDGGEKVTVPLDDPSRPVRIHAHLITGGIVVHGADVRNVIVESRSGGRDGGDRERERERDRERDRRSSSKSNGMKRLELPGSSGLDIVEQDNLVTIRTSPPGHSSTVVITVPRNSSLQLKCMSGGNIEVDGVNGEIDADNLNGDIRLKNVSGSVLAHSLNGEVQATLTRIDGSKPMSFSTMNGDIDVTLPSSLKANLLMKTDQGEIYSDFDVKLNNPAVKPVEGGRQSNGSYHLRFDRTLRGTVGGGGPEFEFRSFNGQIYLRKQN